MGVGFADDGAREEELAVDGFEEGKERSAVREFGVCALFQHADELVKGAVQGLVRPLGANGAEDFGEGFPQRSRKAGGAGFEQVYLDK